MSGYTCGSPFPTCSVASTPAAVAAAARRSASLNSSSAVPTSTSGGGSPFRSANNGDASGDRGSAIQPAKDARAPAGPPGTALASRPSERCRQFAVAAHRAQGKATTVHEQQHAVGFPFRGRKPVAGHADGRHLAHVHVVGDGVRPACGGEVGARSVQRRRKLARPGLPHTGHRHPLSHLGSLGTDTHARRHGPNRIRVPPRCCHQRGKLTSPFRGRTNRTGGQVLTGPPRSVRNVPGQTCGKHVSVDRIWPSSVKGDPPTVPGKCVGDEPGERTRWRQRVSAELGDDESQFGGCGLHGDRPPGAFAPVEHEVTSRTCGPACRQSNIGSSGIADFEACALGGKIQFLGYRTNVTGQATEQGLRNVDINVHARHPVAAVVSRSDVTGSPGSAPLGASSFCRVREFRRERIDFRDNLGVRGRRRSSVAEVKAELHVSSPSANSASATGWPLAAGRYGVQPGWAWGRLPHVRIVAPAQDRVCGAGLRRTPRSPAWPTGTTLATVDHFH